MAKTPYSWFSLGSVSTGTMRTEDLLDSFADELESVMHSTEALNGAHSEILADASAWLGELEAIEDGALNRRADFDDDGAELVNELCNALNEYAPSYTYFGAHPGDGADYGWWPAIDSLEEATQGRDSDVLKVNDLSEIPDSYRGEVMIVNDHGNVTFGYVDSEGMFNNVWDCV